MSKEITLLTRALERLKHINFCDDYLTNELIETIQNHLAQPVQESVLLDEYDAGLLGDFGGGMVHWWHIKH